MSDTETQKVTSEVELFWYFVLGVIGVALLLVMVGIGTRLQSENGAEGLAWMTIAGGGFIAVVVVAFLAAMTCRVMGSLDREQALGMPKGSVRALLMFLVFSLLAVFVFFFH